MFGSVCVGAFACHEIKEGVKVHITGIVGINDGQDTLEVQIALPKNEIKLENHPAEQKFALHTDPFRLSIRVKRDMICILRAPDVRYDSYRSD